MNSQEVRQMIEEALFRYSADKTGIADFALESGGKESSFLIKIE